MTIQKGKGLPNKKPEGVTNVLKKNIAMQMNLL